MSKITTALKQVPLFEGLTEERLEDIGRFFTLVKHEKKAVLHMEGENPDCLNFLIAGTVKAITHLSDDGEKKMINVIYQPGNFFAESSLDKLPLPFTLIAREHVVMLRISTDNFRHILESDLGLFWKFLQQQAMEKLELNRRLTILSQADAKERIKQFLGFVYQQHPLKLPLNLSHEEIGEACSIARETVTRVLGLLKKAGQIKFDGRRIIPCF